MFILYFCKYVVFTDFKRNLLIYKRQSFFGTDTGLFHIKNCPKPVNFANTHTFIEHTFYGNNGIVY